ncbi:MAG: sigma-70 family RNA polymerase sigma factor [Phycisphaerae bacterium]
MAASDGTLVLGVLNGDRAAFAELYDRRARLIRAVCYDATRDFHAAADLAQEVFLRAYRNLGRLRDPQRFGPWLVGIARQVCREWRRERRRESARLAQAAQRHAERAAARMRGDEPVDASQQVRTLWEREQTLTPPLGERERMALHAFYLQGCNADEARAVLGLSRSGFYRALSSACRRLRQALSRQEV